MAAYFNISSFFDSGIILVIAKLPFVNVPVLSKTNIFALFNFSKNEEPLINIPFLDAPPIPAKKDIRSGWRKNMAILKC